MTGAAVAIALETMTAEAATPAGDYPAYKEDPKAETLRVYEVMAKDKTFAESYSKLLGDLVYGDKPELGKAFEATQQFAERLHKT
ncbi:hypothetical protein EDF70_12011 [Neorhizobium sp. JUb45]|nr:hypothetical protein EDF70_12011 [Neorhizobium sp. JUb45]